ncbi:MAG: hypothetical protein QS721_04830 [Candidatus Endonucleobacter sp. (ex Gigantidas childressi)]|nr:hypothetical protein [Candidatus Endonucleobacter sp. (ex Gigantidas childressi)]
MKKVLFVAYGGGHINIVNPIAQKLLEEKEFEFKILALTMAYNKVVNAYPYGIVTKISDYRDLFQQDIAQIEEYGLELLADNYSEHSGISKEDTILYLGLSMFDLADKYGEKKAKELYAKRKRQAFLPVRTMKKILEYEHVDQVVSTTAPRFEQASLIAGNELGITTVEILDLFGEFYPLPEAQHIVCMNKRIKESLVQQGLKNREYYCLGQPAIEQTVNRVAVLDSNNIKSKLNLKNDITILYATQKPIICNADFSYAGFSGYKTINDNVFEIFDKLNKKLSINIILRIHPNEDIKDYQKWLDKYPFVKHVNNVIDLAESISVCDLLLNQSINCQSRGNSIWKMCFYL